MKVAIRSNNWGFEWQNADTKSRWYSIQLPQIMPDRLRPIIINSCKNHGLICFNYAQYTKDKILFVSNQRFL